MESSQKLKPSWIMLAIKAGKVVFPLLIKFGTVLVKVVKSGSMLKLGLGMASFGAYAVLLDPRFAILLMVTLALHETGHVMMMRRFGMVTRGFYFIPLLGGAAVAESAFSSAWNEASVALAGPALGLLTALVPYVLFLVTGEPVFEVAACWIAFMNLLNLLPVHPLDGGRVLRALGMGLPGNRGLLLFAAVSVIGIAYCLRNGYAIFVMFGVLGLGEEFGRRVRNSRGDKDVATQNRRENHRAFRVHLVAALGLPPETNRLDVIQRAVENWQNDERNVTFVDRITELLARDQKNTRVGIALAKRLERDGFPAVLGFAMGARIDGVRMTTTYLAEQFDLPEKLGHEVVDHVESSGSTYAEWIAMISPCAVSIWDQRDPGTSLSNKDRVKLLDSIGKHSSQIFQALPNKSVAAFRLFHDRNAMGPFIGYHTDCRTDAELAFAPREAAATIIGYAALVAVLFELMSATGGHEAASHAVAFFRGL